MRLSRQSTNEKKDSIRINLHAQFPWKKVIIIDLIILVNQISFRMLYPFVAFLIKDYYPDLIDTQLGYKSGWLSSSFNIGTFIGGFLWGYLADYYGRKSILINTLIGSFISMIFFGFSINFTWAFFGRLIWGILNTNIGVAKTYLSEILTNDQQAKGFATVGVMDATGRIIGPVLGGFLGDADNFKGLASAIPLFSKVLYNLFSFMHYYLVL